MKKKNNKNEVIYHLICVLNFSVMLSGPTPADAIPFLLFFLHYNFFNATVCFSVSWCVFNVTFYCQYRTLQLTLWSHKIAPVHTGMMITDIDQRIISITLVYQ